MAFAVNGRGTFKVFVFRNNEGRCVSTETTCSFLIISSSISRMGKLQHLNKENVLESVP